MRGWLEEGPFPTVQRAGKWGGLCWKPQHAAEELQAWLGLDRPCAGSQEPQPPTAAGWAAGEGAGQGVLPSLTDHDQQPLPLTSLEIRDDI